MPASLDVLAHTLEIKEDERQNFARCINRLLDETFILRQLDREDYYFIRKYQSQITAYLNLADWDLLHDDLDHIFQAINWHGANRRALKRLESELLLLLCLSYFEQCAKLQLAETPVMTIDDLSQKYRNLLGNTDRLKSTALREALNALRRYRLIEPVGGRGFNPQNPDQTFQLLPTLRLTLDVEQLEQVQQLLTTYAQQPGEEELAEEET